MNEAIMNELVERIRNYLGNGGLFNPELMDHEKLRDLLIDCRETLEEAEKRSWFAECRAMVDRLIEILRAEPDKERAIELIRFMAHNEEPLKARLAAERAAGREEMRELAANEARRGNNGHDPSDRIAAAIRALEVKHE
jgi:hypothetical protein